MARPQKPHLDRSLAAFLHRRHARPLSCPRDRREPADQAVRSLLRRSCGIYILAGLFIVGGMPAAGCKKERAAAPQQQQQRQNLHIGLVPEQSLFKQVRRYEPLADYLSRHLNMNVILSVMPSYEKVLSGFAAKELDAAFFGSMSYILAHTRLGVEAVARPVNLDGTSTYYGILFVRKDSNIRSVREMRGKRLALVDRNTMAGYLLPLAYFKKEGVDYTTYLKEVYFSGTHEDVIYDVLDRKADIGAAKNTVLMRLAAVDARVKNDLLFLTRTPPVPENCLAVRQDLNVDLKERLRSLMLNMHEDQEGARILRDLMARRFIETRDIDFSAVYRFARDLDIDLNSGDDELVR